MSQVSNLIAELDEFRRREKQMQEKLELLEDTIRIFRSRTECTVCYDPGYMLLDCGHLLCADCLRRLGADEQRLKCPICRSLSEQGIPMFFPS